MPLFLEPSDSEIPLDTFINIVYIPTRRRLYFWKEVRAAAVEHSFDELVKLIDAALAHEEKARELDLLWNGFRSGALSSNPGVLDIDSKVDRTLTGLRDGALIQARGAAEGDDIVDRADAFVEALFPSGLVTVTSLPFTEEVVAVERIVGLLQGELAPMVADFGLTRLAERLAVLAVEYRALLKAASTRPEFDTVRAARQQGQAYVRRVIAMVLGRYHDDTPAHQKARARLLGPIHEQHEAVRGYLSARRRGTPADDEEADLAPPADEPAAEAPVAEAPVAEAPPAAAPVAEAPPAGAPAGI